MVVVELLSLSLTDAAVVVLCRGQQQIHAVGLVHTLGHHLWVENHRAQHIAQFLRALALGHWQLGGGEAHHCLAEELLGEAWYELLAAIVMMDAVGEPHPFEIDRQGLEVVALSVAFVVGVDALQGLADTQVVFAVLVVEDVSSLQRSLSEVVNVLLLLKGEGLESFYLVAKHLKVSEPFVVIGEFLIHLCCCSKRGSSNKG